MSLIGKIATGLFLLLVIVGSWLYFSGTESNPVEKLLSGDEPIGIRIAFVSEDENGKKTELLSQAVIYPDIRSLVVYSLNTDAALDEETTPFQPVRDLSPSSGDVFQELTGVRSRYYIHLNQSSLARLVDLAGGFPSFFEHNEVYPGARFQYPRGGYKIPGQQVVEYLTLDREEKDPNKKYLLGVERLYRAESVFLSGFWNLGTLSSELLAPEIWSLIHGFLDTNLNTTELRSLISYFSEPSANCYMREVPLDTGETSGSNNTLRNLYLKRERGKEVFDEIRKKIEGDIYIKGAYHVDVLNGTERGGLAKRVKQYIQSDRLQVLDVDNFPYKPLKETMILDRSGSTAYPARLARLTGLTRDRVVFKRMPLDVQSTLVIGTDFDFKKIKLEQ